MTNSSDGQNTPGRERELQTMAEAVRGSYRTVEDRTQSFIRDAILKGIYRPGERLHQDRIAALLGVSRMPVRASLRQLEAEGLVSIRPHMGATVSILRPDEIAELYELRVLLESHLLEHAIPKLTPERLAELSELASKTDEVAGKAPEDWLKRRRAFYQKLYEFAERPRALEMADRLRMAVGRYLLWVRVDEQPTAHLDLFRYLEARDVKGAKRWLARHLQKVNSQLQQLVVELGEQGVSEQQEGRGGSTGAGGVDQPSTWTTDHE